MLVILASRGGDEAGPLDGIASDPSGPVEISTTLAGPVAPPTFLPYDAPPVFSPGSSVRARARYIVSWLSCWEHGDCNGRVDDLAGGETQPQWPRVELGG